MCEGDVRRRGVPRVVGGLPPVKPTHHTGHTAPQAPREIQVMNTPATSHTAALLHTFNLVGECVATTRDGARVLLHVCPEGEDDALMPLEVRGALVEVARTLASTRRRVLVTGHLEVGVFVHDDRQSNHPVLLARAITALDS